MPKNVLKNPKHLRSLLEKSLCAALKIVCFKTLILKICFLYAKWLIIQSAEKQQISIIAKTMTMHKYITIHSISTTNCTALKFFIFCWSALMQTPKSTICNYYSTNLDQNWWLFKIIIIWFLFNFSYEDEINIYVPLWMISLFRYIVYCFCSWWMKLSSKKASEFAML